MPYKCIKKTSTVKKGKKKVKKSGYAVVVHPNNEGGHKRKVLPGISTSKKKCQDRIKAIAIHTHSESTNPNGHNTIKNAFLTGDSNGKKTK